MPSGQCWCKRLSLQGWPSAWFGFTSSHGNPCRIRKMNICLLLRQPGTMRHIFIWLFIFFLFFVDIFLDSHSPVASRFVSSTAVLVESWHQVTKPEYLASWSAFDIFRPSFWHALCCLYLPPRFDWAGLNTKVTRVMMLLLSIGVHWCPLVSLLVWPVFDLQIGLAKLHLGFRCFRCFSLPTI